MSRYAVDFILNKERGKTLFTCHRLMLKAERVVKRAESSAEFMNLSQNCEVLVGYKGKGEFTFCYLLYSSLYRAMSLADDNIFFRQEGVRFYYVVGNCMNSASNCFFTLVLL